ncbi:hypothetical protein FISHEDRAFT_63510 [Fistulina hepatica ATCC 64428]|uniref:Uncharacterized protein n=1 Tax=Fistulina hepatica ATCC 64428 TaxID=1128425 RepID=A0A0D7ANE8_9AGAR|nr:hypothetical protein FISHEDRAFT_63510 [Fistulina hepatica ATCC 64428]
MFQPPIEEVVLEGEDQSEQAAFDNMEQDAPTPRGHSQALSVVQSHGGYADECDDSPGQQLLEQELYKLRVKASSSVQGGLTHAPSQLSNPASYEVVPDTQEIEEEMHVAGLPTIPDTNGDAAPEDPPSPPLPPVPVDDDAQDQQLGALWNQNAMYNGDLPPWQLVHKRLLGWAMVWPLSEIDAALNSTTRGHQVDEVALSIWSTQTYKRYVRSRLMDVPPSRVDRLFVPPNIADAINTAVYNGRHGDASSMLRDLWTSFGLDGMPRLLIVLAKHRHDESHWVVHRFSLPEGGLSTYDSFPQKTLPDGRPLGWWFAIRTAWPNAIYPSPDHLVQKMIRLHRPMQLPIDNSVAAAGIWRNVLMGSRGERSVDLERVRDLINTEVKNLRMRKTMGKLAIAAPRPTWQGMNDMA